MSTQEAEQDETEASRGRVYRRLDPIKHKAQVRAANKARYRALRDTADAFPEFFMERYRYYGEVYGVDPKGPRKRPAGEDDGTAA
jgi:hypothetical protein